MSLKISRILHAGYVFECDEIQIAFDTIFENPFSKNCYAFPNVRFDEKQIRNLKFAAVFISHHHDDHCSLESLNLLDRETPIYMYCLFDELFMWIKELGFKYVYPLRIDEAVKVGPFEVIPRRALDADVDSLFQIKAAGLNVLNVVDSWIDDEVLHQLVNEKPWDIVLWPFQTMRELEVISPLRADPAPTELPVEWIEQLQQLEPAYIVPSSCQFIQESWSWYNHAFFPISYRQFQSEIEMKVPQAKVVRLNPSVSIEVEKNSVQLSSPLSWIEPIGNQDVDYDYQKNLVPPTAEEVAKHFSVLNAEQVRKVSDYCRHGLIEKYQSIGRSDDLYFNKRRVWQLAVYDHQGMATNYFYLLDDDHIEVLTENPGNVAWLTEVAAAKIFGALEAGETLTSMYMRINDKVFPGEIEKEIANVDIGEDPLIRCLFTGVFCAYQKMQLARIQGKQ